MPCAIAIRDMGLRFIGVVKTATKQYPQHYLSKVEFPEKGDYKGVLNIEPITGYMLLAFYGLVKNVDNLFLTVVLFHKACHTHSP